MELKVTRIEEQATYCGFKFKVITDANGQVTVYRVTADRPWIPPCTFVLTLQDGELVWKHSFKVITPEKFTNKVEAMNWLTSIGDDGVTNAAMEAVL